MGMSASVALVGMLRPLICGFLMLFLRWDFKQFAQETAFTPRQVWQIFQTPVVALPCSLLGATQTDPSSSMHDHYTALHVVFSFVLLSDC